MIPVPPGWSERRSGNATLLVPLEPSVQSIRIDERVTPLRAFPAIVAEVLQRSPAFVQTSKRAINRLMTDEGEFAAAVTIGGVERTRSVWHAIAVVFGDDVFTVYDGRTTEPSFDELERVVRDLAKRHRQYFGVRRRRFYFRPPPGWHVVGGLHLDAAMFPGDYPVHTSVMQVWPAMPLVAIGSTTPIDDLDRQDDAAGLALDPTVSLGGTPLQTRGGLAGHEWRRVRYGFSGFKVVRHIVELRDQVYAYRFRLDCGDHDQVDRHRELFFQMIATAAPLPAPVVEVAARSPASDLSLLLGVD